jgi:hypothetical protein
LKRGFQIPFVWTVAQFGRIDQADCVITHAGARNNDGNPGLLNEAMSSALGLIQEYRSLPVFAQGDFAPCINPRELAGVTPWQGDPEEVRRVWLESIGVKKKAPYYIESWDVALWHAKVCREHGFKRPILLSYNPHIVRAYWASKQVGLDVIVPWIPKAVYDPNCSQPWMRSRVRNTLREIPARYRDLLLGHL